MRYQIKRLAAALALVLTLWAPQLAAQSLEDTVRTQLSNQGFYNVEVTRTLLGRLRFRAESDDLFREIVINPTTGAVLRDFWRSKSGRGGFGLRLASPQGDEEGENGFTGSDEDAGGSFYQGGGEEAGGGAGGGDGGRGEDDDDDDDEEEDDDDDDDDDDD